MRPLELVRDTLVGPSAGEVALHLAEVPMGGTSKLTSPGAVYGKDESLYTSNVLGGWDPNAELSGRIKYEIYQEMRRSDPAVRSLEWMLRLPIRAADWSIKPASHEPVDQIIADCIGWQFGLKVDDSDYRNAIGRLAQSWKESLAQALFVIVYGCMAEELIWSKETEKWRDQDGDEHTIRPLARLAPRMPVTILNLDVDEITGQIKTVEQDLPDTRPIPGDKIAWYVIDAEADLWGTSILRPAYGPWKLKRGLMTGAAIGWDRWAAGLPLVRYPRNAPNAEARANLIGKGIRTHERGWVALESGDEWSLDIINGSGSIADPVPLLQHYDAQIAMAGLQQFSSLGVTQTGSRAVGDVLSKPYYEAAQAVADDIAMARMRQIFRRFVDYNFGSKYDMPELICTGIEADDLQALAGVLADLSSAGLSFTDPDTANDIRRRLKFRELPEAALEALRKLPPTVGVAANRPAPAGKVPPGEGGSIAA